MSNFLRCRNKILAMALAPFVACTALVACSDDKEEIKYYATYKSDGTMQVRIEGLAGGRAVGHTEYSCVNGALVCLRATVTYDNGKVDHYVAFPQPNSPVCMDNILTPNDFPKYEVYTVETTDDKQ